MAQSGKCLRHSAAFIVKDRKRFKKYRTFVLVLL